MNDDEVFKALADPSRRTLLDLLFQRSGMTLTELQSHLPMTRFGTMKHLRQLEEAGLIITRKIGREKHHYLNPVPIQTVYDRWVSKYAQPWAQTLTGLKYVLEETTPMTTPTQVFEIYIRTTPERLWKALTDGSMTQQYYFHTRVESSWEQGAPYRHIAADESTLLDGEVIESDPPRRLVQTFRPLWMPDGANSVPSKVTWEIEQVGANCKLLLIHEATEGSVVNQGMVSGWSQILSGLKTLLETGEPLQL